MAWLLQIAKCKAVAVGNLAAPDRDGLVEDRAGEDESVEFAVFAARVHVFRKVGEKLRSEFAAGKAAVELTRIDRHGNGAKTERTEFACEFACIAFPERKEGAHADAGEIAFAIFAQIREEDVSEGDSADAGGELRLQHLLHARLIDRVAALGRN